MKPGTWYLIAIPIFLTPLCCILEVHIWNVVAYFLFPADGVSNLLSTFYLFKRWQKLEFANNTLIAISKTFWHQCAVYWKFIFWTVVLLIFLLSCWWCFSYVVNALSFQALTKAGICNAQSTDNPLSLWSLPVLIEHNVRFRQFPFRFYCIFLNLEQGVKLNNSFKNQILTEIW